VKLASFTVGSTLLNVPRYSPFVKCLEAVDVDVGAAVVTVLDAAVVGVVDVVEVASASIFDALSDEPHPASKMLVIARLMSACRVETIDKRYLLASARFGCLRCQPAAFMDSRMSTISVRKRNQIEASSLSCCHTEDAAVNPTGGATEP
jgi:hypothetical protein